MSSAVAASSRSAHTLESLRYALETIAELTQFRVAVLNLVRGEDLVVVAATGVETAVGPDGRSLHISEVIGSTLPVSVFHEFAQASIELGSFYFLPEGTTDAFDDVGWVQHRERSDAPGAWRPDDTLAAPLWNRDGDLLGVLSLDEPVDGIRPPEDRIRLLSRWVEYANQVVLEALEREALEQRSLLLARSRKALSLLATAPVDPHDILLATRDTLKAAFHADDLAIHTFANPAWGLETHFSVAGDTPGGQEEVYALAEKMARVAWRRGEVVVWLSGEPEANARAGVPRDFDLWLAGRDNASTLMVPIGADREAMGLLTVMRRADHTPWSELEQQEARDLGHDIGHILRSSRTLKREQDLASAMRALDEYRTKLITSVSAELTKPLATVVAAAPRLSVGGTVDGDSLTAIVDAAQRMTAVIDDLLMLSRITDPTEQVELHPLDLTTIVEQALQETRTLADGVTLSLHASGPAMMRGRREALIRSIRALINLSIVCTPAGGFVDVTVRDSPTGVELIIEDNGLGLEPDQLQRLFEEFHRLPQAGEVMERSTGLGLAIAYRTIERHLGAVSVDSAPGLGTTIRVTLPLG